MSVESTAVEPSLPGSSRSRPVRLKDVLCIGPIVLHSLYYWVTVPLGPSLIGTRPLLLAGLRGSIPALLTVGAFAHAGRIPLWAALLVPLPNLFFDDPFLYWAGRRYGRRLIDLISRNNPRMRRRIARGERLFARYGVWAVLLANPLPAPSGLFFIAAGETGMDFRLFLLADLAGTMIFIGGYVALGWLAGDRAVAVAERISQYGVRATIAFLVIIVVWSVWSGWRQSSDRERERA